jgi:hypothetical protein
MPEERQSTYRNNGFLSSPFAGDRDNNNCTVLIFIIVFLLLFTDFGVGRF